MSSPEIRRSSGYHEFGFPGDSERFASIESSYPISSPKNKSKPEPLDEFASVGDRTMFALSDATFHPPYQRAPAPIKPQVSAAGAPKREGTYSDKQVYIPADEVRQNSRRQSQGSLQEMQKDVLTFLDRNRRNPQAAA
ncbi:hypothetical protein DSL72_002622 [Monilinia vaccinii-corymbosi]|uniref:Uncharacterized protein n=1 Tax=Monilinia vaccinii-corymbosi TaxID=61207 RepID=A0A8A3PD13_9HELO|nr:hypothetical protein DSL72_002622 [Monilinia vaccinii-corymbosi]